MIYVLLVLSTVVVTDLLLYSSKKVIHQRIEFFWEHKMYDMLAIWEYFKSKIKIKINLWSVNTWFDCF